MTDTKTRSSARVNRFLTAGDAVLAHAMRRDNPDGEEWEAAWLAFDVRYAGALMALILKMAGYLGRDECADLFAVTSERILRYIGRFEDRGETLRSWSFKVAQNVVLARLRAGRRAAMEDDFLSFEDVAEELQILDAVDPADDGVSERASASGYGVEEAELVRTAFEKLTTRDQAVLDLTVTNDFPHVDVARIIGVEAPLVRKIRYKAIGRLKKKYQALKAKPRRR
jgi:RNA polymerase sigma factor (sigma-70 family)